jgi:hypothetical protein
MPAAEAGRSGSYLLQLRVLLQRSVSRCMRLSQCTLELALVLSVVVRGWRGHRLQQNFAGGGHRRAHLKNALGLQRRGESAGSRSGRAIQAKLVQRALHDIIYQLRCRPTFEVETAVIQLLAGGNSRYCQRHMSARLLLGELGLQRCAHFDSRFFFLSSLTQHYLRCRVNIFACKRRRAAGADLQLLDVALVRLARALHLLYPLLLSLDHPA